MPRPKKEQPNRKDGLYEVKITTGKTLEGKLIRKSFYSSISKDDARRQAEEWKVSQKVAQQTGNIFVEKTVTFADWARKWLETYKKGKVKSNTFNGSYKYPVENHLIPYFGKALLDEIKPYNVQAFFDLKSKTSSFETIKKMRACLYAIFDTAVENDLCRKNPVTKNITISSEIKPPQKRTYTQEQYDKIFEFAKSQENQIDILILLETGITRSELLGLKWNDIDFEMGVINIRQGVVEQKSQDTGKWELVSAGLKNEYRARPIPVSSILLEILRNQNRVSPYIFPNSKGNVMSPMNWYKRKYLVFMRDMNAQYPEIPILSPHELRHTRATLWKDQGVDIFSIAKLMGHVDLDMLSKRYAHNNVEALKKALGY